MSTATFVGAGFNAGKMRVISWKVLSETEVQWFHIWLFRIMTAVRHKQPALSLVVGSEIWVQKIKRGQT